MKKIIALALLICLKISTLSAQCTEQVLHTNGSATVNGVLVTVSSSGVVDSNSVYCTNTYPYFVGYNYGTGSGNGVYNFTFSPAASSVTLNFSGFSNQGVNSEVVFLTVNGQHYPIPAAGVSNGCDPLAVLNSSGDIEGCVGCGVSGWNGTTITDTITSLSILDSAISGFGNGALFSLFICKGIVTNIIEPQEISNYELYPNPFSFETTLKTNVILENATLTVYNSLGQQVKQIQNISGQTINPLCSY